MTLRQVRQEAQIEDYREQRRLLNRQRTRIWLLCGACLLVLIPSYYYLPWMMFPILVLLVAVLTAISPFGTWHSLFRHRLNEERQEAFESLFEEQYTAAHRAAPGSLETASLDEAPPLNHVKEKLLLGREEAVVTVERQQVRHLNPLQETARIQAPRAKQKQLLLPAKFAAILLAALLVIVVLAHAPSELVGWIIIIDILLVAPVLAYLFDQKGIIGTKEYLSEKLTLLTSRGRRAYHAGKAQFTAPSREDAAQKRLGAILSAETVDTRGAKRHKTATQYNGPQTAGGPILLLFAILTQILPAVVLFYTVTDQCGGYRCVLPVLGASCISFPGALLLLLFSAALLVGNKQPQNQTLRGYAVLTILITMPLVIFGLFVIGVAVFDGILPRY